MSCMLKVLLIEMLYIYTELNFYSSGANMCQLSYSKHVNLMLRSLWGINGLIFLYGIM